MENISTTRPLEGRTLHFTTIDLNQQVSESEEQRDSVANVRELMSRFVLGNELATNDTVFINGRNALEALPRPETFGTTRLAVMAILDTMAPEEKMAFTIQEVDSHASAAD